MNPRDPRDQYTARYEPGYQPENYSESAYGRDPGHDRRPDYGRDPGYDRRPDYGRDPGYDRRPDYGRDPGYDAYQQSDYPERRPRRSGPEVDIGKFAGGVFAAAVVSALAAWLCAWVIEVIGTRMTQNGRFGVWNPMAQDAYWFAVAAGLCAVLAGVLYYALRLATPSPEVFFTWIVGMLTAAAVITPLLFSNDIWVGVTTAIEHLVIGLPILSMVRMVGIRSVIYR
ncbi:hypothetical protein ABIA39_005387 [Nocardia sp. GAS34]|uniref:DUF6069 family protein n=1 Tax=unclassified Nocardia TaxID=2637762 RepID=UPI003D1E877C